MFPRSGSASERASAQNGERRSQVLLSRPSQARGDRSSAPPSSEISWNYDPVHNLRQALEAGLVRARHSPPGRGAARTPWIFARRAPAHAPWRSRSILASRVSFLPREDGEIDGIGHRLIAGVVGMQVVHDVVVRHESAWDWPGPAWPCRNRPRRRRRRRCESSWLYAARISSPLSL